MTKLLPIALVLSACSSKTQLSSPEAVTELRQLADQLCACSTSECGTLADHKFSSRYRDLQSTAPEVLALNDQVYACKAKLVDLVHSTERCSSKLQIAMERVLIDKTLAAPGPYQSTEGHPWPKKIYDHCNDDRWPVPVIRCMTAAETRVAFDSCVAAVPHELRAKLGADASLASR